MESTGVFWQPVFNLLEGSFIVVLANAQHIKAVPGRKTDVKDWEWLADLLAHGLIRASFIPHRIHALREVTRHRKSLIRDRVRVINRIHKLLEAANIKLGTVVTHLDGVTGHAILKALAGGETDADVSPRSHVAAFGRKRRPWPRHLTVDSASITDFSWTNS